MTTIVPFTTMHDACIYLQNTNPAPFQNGEMVDIELFQKRLNKAANGMLNNFDWQNVILAGDLMEGLLRPHYDAALYENSDFDFMVYGHPSEVGAAINRIIAHFQKYMCARSRVLADSNNTSLRILIPGQRAICVIAYCATTASGVLDKIDLTHAKVGYQYGKTRAAMSYPYGKIITHPEFLATVSSGVSAIVLKKCYLSRIDQAFERGYSIGKLQPHQSPDTVQKLAVNNDSTNCLWNLQAKYSELKTKKHVKHNRSKNFVPDRNADIDAIDEMTKQNYPCSRIVTEYAGLGESIANLL